MAKINGNRNATFCGLFAAVVFSAPTYGQSPEEQQMFDQVRARMEGNAGHMPHGVGDASLSFSQPLCWGMSFPCPDPPPTGVTFIVCTTLVPWMPNPNSPTEAAAYVWTSSPVVSMDEEADVKIIQYDNQIMLDVAVFQQFEQLGSFGQVMNEGLLYHEFLHGQLGIEWLQTQEATDIACACNTPDPSGHSDPGHDSIPGWQDTYNSSVASTTGAIVETVRPEADPEGDGTFSVRVGQKDGWTGIATASGDGNVENVAVSDPDGDGSIVVSGKLKDKTKPGQVLVAVDPAGTWIFGYVTVAATFEGIPATSTLALLALATLLIAGAAVVLRRRQSPDPTTG